VTHRICLKDPERKPGFRRRNNRRSRRQVRMRLPLFFVGRKARNNEERLSGNQTLETSAASSTEASCEVARRVETLSQGSESDRPRIRGTATHAPMTKGEKATGPRTKHSAQISSRNEVWHLCAESDPIRGRVLQEVRPIPAPIARVFSTRRYHGEITRREIGDAPVASRATIASGACTDRNGEFGSPDGRGGREARNIGWSGRPEPRFYLLAVQGPPSPAEAFRKVICSFVEGTPQFLILCQSIPRDPQFLTDSTHSNKNPPCSHSEQHSSQ
jgi:hypothetical protein